MQRDRDELRGTAKVVDAGRDGTEEDAADDQAGRMIDELAARERLAQRTNRSS